MGRPRKQRQEQTQGTVPPAIPDPTATPARRIPRVTVVIPYRTGEPLLQWTVDNIRRDAPGAEILAIEDVPEKGVDPRRHEGIDRARGEIVIVADAHVDPLPGCVDRMVAALETRPDSVACCCCVRANREQAEVRDYAGRERYYGADLHLLAPEHLICRESWRTEHPGKLSTVPVILGGFYAFWRRRYFDIGAPWQYMLSKGWSEPVLSIANYRCGGASIVVPDAECAHVWLPSAVWTDRPYKQLHNQLFLVHSLCDSDGALLDHLRLEPNRAAGTMTRSLLASNAVQLMREHLGRVNARPWSDYRAEFGGEK